jgi:hypothetical protein
MAGAGLDLKAIKDNIADEVFQPNENGNRFLMQWLLLLPERKMVKPGY